MLVSECDLDEIWRRVEVSDWAPWVSETQGTSEAQWLVCPETREHWLYKDVKIPSNGNRQGEDWAEVMGACVANLLGVPCARVQLAHRAGRDGSISLKVTPPGCRQWDAQVWLPAAPGVEGYEQHYDKKAELQRPGYNLQNIKRALLDVSPPSGPNQAALSAFDVFCGFLVLDALIANQDRHEQNWGIIEPDFGDGPMCLAPSYDHASGLGRNLTDHHRKRLLDDASALRIFAERGRAIRFEHTRSDGACSLANFAADALEMCSDAGSNHWRTRIRSLDLTPALQVLDHADETIMSDPARRFAGELLQLNLRRMRDAINAREHA